MDIFDSYFERLPSWIRWVLFLPLSVFVYVAANFLTNIGGALLNFFSREPWSDRLFTHLVSPAVAGYFSVSFAVAMVPKNKLTFALIITAIWILIYGVLITFSVLTGDWKSAIPGVVSAVTAVYSYVEIKGSQQQLLSTSYSPEVEK
jgi:hypothetical protein